ncbi:MAG TPA: NUDIX domain-containing protein, partial [Candidatus Dormibacteraeota bacterium]
VVHRPDLADWSLPKGKLEDDEHPLVGAVREVLEETGVRGGPQLRLPTVSYVMADGRPKTVDFWLMRAGDAPPAAVLDPTEVDEIRWLSPAEAKRTLSYPGDIGLVEYVSGLPPVTATTPLVRHALAGSRKQWSGEDALRPLDEDGRAQAAGLAVVVALCAPRRLFAATPLRCKQTLEPLAERLGLPVVTDSAFAEPAKADEVPAKVQVAQARLAELRSGPPAAICSQGKLIPPLLARLTGATDPAPYKTPKGGGWLLTWSGGQLVALSQL